MDWIGLFLSIVVIGMVVGLFLWALNALPLIPDVIHQILRVLLVVGAVLSILSMLLGHGPMIHMARIR